MFLEVVTWKIGVAFHDVHDDRSPGFNVSGLRFVEPDEAPDDVCAKPGSCQYVEIDARIEFTYGINAASVAPRLRRRSSPSS